MEVAKMWVRAIKDYYHSRTGTKIITEGKQYNVVASHKMQYTIKDDNNKVFPANKDIFEIMPN